MLILSINTDMIIKIIQFEEVLIVLVTQFSAVELHKNNYLSLLHLTKTSSASSFCPKRALCGLIKRPP